MMIGKQGSRQGMQLPMSIPAFSPSPAGSSSSWYEGAGDYRMLGGSSLTSSCEPHFHETYIVAYVKRGSTRVNARGREFDWTPGTVFLANPYEIVSCFGAEGFDYDVCYPSRRFMEEVGRLVGREPGSVPQFASSLLTGREAKKIGSILASFCNGRGKSDRKSVG